MITQESQQKLATDVEHYTREFLVLTEKKLPPSYAENVKQYFDHSHTKSLYKKYYSTITNARQQGLQTILDVGSGINFAKLIDSAVITSNPRGRGIGFNEHFNFVNKNLNVPTDIELDDINTNDTWILTNQTFDLVLIHRFLPWPDTPYRYDVYKRFINEIARVTGPNGHVWFFTNNQRAFIERAGINAVIWKRTQNGFLVTTKQLLESVLTKI